MIDSQIPKPKSVPSIRSAPFLEHSQSELCPSGKSSHKSTAGLRILNIITHCRSRGRTDPNGVSTTRQEWRNSGLKPGGENGTLKNFRRNAKKLADQPKSIRIKTRDRPSQRAGKQ